MKVFHCLVILGCLATSGFATPAGKKLLSFPTLVSILKAKNASRPLSAPSPTLDKVPSHQMTPVIAPEMPPMAIMVPPIAFPVPAAAVAPETVQVESPPTLTASKQDNVCSPVSKETNAQITKLCDINGLKGSKGDDENFSASRGSSCLKRFCVTIIPGEDEDLESAFNSEISVYTECEAVQTLFKVLVKSEVTPKCFDCSK